MGAATMLNHSISAKSDVQNSSFMPFGIKLLFQYVCYSSSPELRPERWTGGLL